MRIKMLVVAGSVLALAATPATFGKNAETHKADDKSTPSAACHAYQKADDGSWIERPCQEGGAGQSQHKPAAKGTEDEPR